jgi:hypothetical protein
MPSRVPRPQGHEPLDLRVAAAFVVLTLVLVAPGLVHALTPTDEQGLQDAASTLESQAREAVALIEHRSGTTDPAFAAELQDLAGEAEEMRSDLLRQAVTPDAMSKRDQLADAASQVADATDDASLAAADRARLDQDRGKLETVIQTLHELGGGS